jgi:uncharacterized membrane protein
MDRSASAGIIGAAIAIGRSFQPNLLTRGSTDQAIITGASSVIAYESYSAADALLTSVASRLGKTDEPSAGSRLLVAGTAGLLGAGGAFILRWREHEPSSRAFGRLAAQTLAVTAGASVLATSASRDQRVGPGLPHVVLALAVGVGSWATTKPWKSLPGSATYPRTAVSTEFKGKYFFEDQVREVTPGKAAGIGVGVAGITLGLSYAESALTNALAKGATYLFGGQPQDHRLMGRTTSLAIFASAGWLAIGQADRFLAKSGGGIDTGLEIAPTIPEVTGSSESGLAWNKQTREGARWLTMTLPPETINSVMQIQNARQPIRVYASSESGANKEERAQVLLREIDRTKALERKAFAIFSPTGSGYVNYVATETFEYLMQGDCASAAIQYSVLPSALSLTRVDEGTAQTRMVLQGVVERLLAMPEEKRPKFYLFGESLGSQVSEEMFRGLGSMGLLGTELDATLWIGTPAATKWRDQLWGKSSLAEAPLVNEAGIYLPRTLSDWIALAPEDRDRIKFLLLQNGNDPIPKFGIKLLWRQPDWLGPADVRQMGAPSGTRWVPITTYLMTFLDMMNALLPIPGTFGQGGHDYRAVLPQAIQETWRLAATDEQMERVNKALRQRELAWELYRGWASANAKPAQDVDKCRAKVLKNATRYAGFDVDEVKLQEIVNAGRNPIMN